MMKQFTLYHSLYKGIRYYLHIRRRLLQIYTRSYLSAFSGKSAAASSRYGRYRYLSLHHYFLMVFWIVSISNYITDYGPFSVFRHKNGVIDP